MRWRTVLILGSACVASAPAGARAGDPPPSTVRLEYSSGGRCPDEQEFKDAMAGRVHRELFDDPSATARLVVKLEARGDLYEGAAALSDAPGVVAWIMKIGPVREDCSAVMDALSISVAIKLEPFGWKPQSPPVASAVPPAPPAPPPAPPMKQPPAELPVEPKIPTPPRPRPSFYMGLSGGAAFGAVPGVAGTVALDFGVHPPGLPFSFGAQLRIVLPSALAVGDDQAAISRYTGALVACSYFLRYLDACGLVEAGGLVGSAQHNRFGLSSYAALGGQVGFAYPVHPLLSLRASAEGLLKLTPTDLRRQYETGQRLDWKAPGASATVMVGPVFTF